MKKLERLKRRQDNIRGVREALEAERRRGQGVPATSPASDHPHTNAWGLTVSPFRRRRF
jgi:hypothetical protein